MSAPSSSSSNRPHAPGEIAAELRPLLTRRGSVPPLAPGRFKSAPSRLRPSLLPRSRFCACRAPRKAATVAPGSPSSVDAPPRGQPPPSRLRLLFPLGELRRPPLYLPVSLFLVFVGFPCLGRELRGPWSPAMAATALAPVSGRRNGMAATPLLPPRSPVPSVVNLVNRRP